MSFFQIITGGVFFNNLTKAIYLNNSWWIPSFIHTTKDILLMIPIRDKVRNARNSPLNNSGLLFLISLAGIPIREGRMIPIRFGSSVKDR